MGKWEAESDDGVEWPEYRIKDENSVTLFLVMGSEEYAHQIVREHNAHGELVDSIEELINCVYGHPREDCDISAVSDARAVLARAEGRG